MCLLRGNGKIEVKFYLRIIIFLLFCVPLVSSSEELADVLKDAYNFYPDIEKSKTELQISEKDLIKLLESRINGKPYKFPEGYVTSLGQPNSLFE